MAPDEYIQARKSAEKSEDYHVIVDEFPYYPFLRAHPDDSNSIRKVVTILLNIKPSSELEISPVKGGNTNTLYFVSNLKCSPGKLLVRLFGGDGLIDRDVETATYAALARQSLALPYYGRFANGRLEGWYDGSCLVESEMPTYALQIAQSTAKLHVQFQIPASLKPFHDLTRKPTMWQQMENWMQTALKANYSVKKDQERVVTLNVPALEDELEFLRAKVVSNNATVGFCHNDLLAANIMKDESQKNIQLIDFEYGGMNYWSYDIANHFNEFCGGTDESATPDYTKFPSSELQRNFVVEYLNVRNALASSSGDVTPSESQIQQLLWEVKGFVLANHLVWGLWAVNQAATEGSDSWTYESATGEPPVPFANSADDGLCDPLTTDQAIDWVKKTKFQIVALPGGSRGRPGEVVENVMLLAHDFVVEKLKEPDGKEVTLFLALAGLGDEVSPVSLDPNKLSSPLSEYISFKGDKEGKGLENLRPPSFKQFLEARLDTEHLIGLKGKKISTRNGTNIKWLLEKGSALTMTPYLIQKILRKFYEEENVSVMRITAREELLYGFCEMVKMQVESKSLTAKKAQEKYHHHLLLLWVLAQPEVAIEEYPFSKYHPDDFVFEGDEGNPLRQLAKIDILMSNWKGNIEGQEEESDEDEKKMPPREEKKKGKKSQDDEKQGQGDRGGSPPEDRGDDGPFPKDSDDEDDGQDRVRFETLVQRDSKCR